MGCSDWGTIAVSLSPVAFGKALEVLCLEIIKKKQKEGGEGMWNKMTRYSLLKEGM